MGGWGAAAAWARMQPTHTLQQQSACDGGARSYDGGGLWPQHAGRGVESAGFLALCLGLSQQGGQPMAAHRVERQGSIRKETGGRLCGGRGLLAQPFSGRGNAEAGKESMLCEQLSPCSSQRMAALVAPRDPGKDATPRLGFCSRGPRVL